MTKRDIDYSLRYALIFHSKKLRNEAEKIARDTDRSLNYVINQAIEEFVAARRVNRPAR